MISVVGLVKSYGGIKAVSDISFEVEEGCVYGLLGPNGAGKSTTMNIITGYIGATDGRVTIDGVDILEEPLKAKSLVGYLPELPPLYPDMTVREYLTFVCELKRVEKANIARSVDEAVKKTSLKNVENRLIKNLSKGYKQRVGIAQAILGSPKVIILDEPTVGLDPQQIIEIRQLIKDLGKEHTVILSSHILSEVSEICDRILIINKGKLVAQGTPAELANNMNKGITLKLTLRASRESFSNAVADLANARILSIDELNNGELTAQVDVDSDDDKVALAQALSNNGILVLGMEARETSLEEVFLQLTSEDARTEMEANNDSDI